MIKIIGFIKNIILGEYIMMKCPLCNHASHTRTSRYLTSGIKEVYYQCQNLTCSSTFKTIESVEKILSQPLNNSTISSGMPCPV